MENHPDSIFDNGQILILSKETMVFDITVGSIKHGPELTAPSYFLSGGYQLPC